MKAPLLPEQGVRVTRVELSIGSLDLFRFEGYDHAFPRHSHDRFTIGVFGSGNGSIAMGGSSSKAVNGALLTIPPDAAHSAEPEPGSGWTYRSLCPSAELMDAALGSPPDSVRFSMPVCIDDSLGKAIGSVHRDLEQRGSTLGNEERLLRIFRSLVRRHGSGTVESSSASPSRSVIEARRYLDDNYRRAVKLAELSCVCGMSPFHLIRSFSDSVGMTPHAYLMQVRATRARDLLQRGVPASATAFECGFSDQSHLTRTFKRIFGVTPGAYAHATTRAD